MALVNKRIIDLPERAELNSDDYTVVDGSNGGTAKYRLSKMQEDITEVDQDVEQLSGTVTQHGQQLTTINQTVTQNTSDITDLKADLSQKATVIVNASDEAEVVTFSDGADDMPMKSVVLKLVPHQSGSGDPSPSNVRPISGYDAVTVKRSGKNLIQFPYQSGDSLTSNGITWTANADGSVTVNGTATGTSLFWLYGTTTSPLMPTLEEGEEVYFAINGQSSRQGVNGQMVFYGGTAVTLSSSTNKLTIPSMATHTGMVVILRIGSGITVNNVTVYPMIRRATDSDGAYEPYTGYDTYPIILPQTVYGGELDVVSGKLKVTHGMVTLTGSESDMSTTAGIASGSVIARIPIDSASHIETVKVGLVANYLPETTPYSSWRYADPSVATNSQGNQLWMRLPNVASLADARTYLSEHNLTVVYPLATPTEITLDPTTIKTLLGTNTIWMSAEGTIQAEYPADTKLYIDALTVPDDDMIADSNIASGKYFTVNNKLYLSTTAIAQGEQIVVGTNCTETNLAEALNALNA